MTELAAYAQHCRRMAAAESTLLGDPADVELWHQLADEIDEHVNRDQDQAPGQLALPIAEETTP